MTENENTTTPEPQEKTTNAVPEEVGNELSDLAAKVKAEREGADRARMTTAIVFIILIAVVAGYTFMLNQTVKKFMSPEGVVNMAVLFAEQGMAEALGPAGSGDTSWEATFIAFVENKSEQMGDYLIDALRDEENAEAIREKVAEAIHSGGSQAVGLLSTNVLPELQKVSMIRIEGEVESLLSTLDEQLDAVISRIIEENQANLAKLTSDIEVERSIANAFEDRMGDYIDTATSRIKKHVSDVKESIVSLANTEGSELTDEQKLEILILQVMHHHFQKVSDAEIREAAGM